MEEFRVNELITLRLIDGKTIIYVNNKEFEQCKHLLLNVPVVENFNQEINSIDEAEEHLEIYMGDETLTPEEEFMGHCSNLQAWAENQYTTTLLHRTLAFPLLKELSERGDHTAKQRFKEEITRRYKYGSFSVQEFLFEEGYLNYLTDDDVLSGILAPEDALFMERFLKTKEKYSPIPYIDLMRKQERDYLLYSVKEGKIWDLELRIDEEITYIPNSIENLTNLERLMLDINYPSPNIFGEEFEAASVRTLRIICSGVVVIPDLIYYFPNLENLAIAGFFGRAIIHLEKSFCKLPNLKKLSLYRINFEKFPDSIVNLKNLEDLTIEHSNLQNSGLDLIEKLESLTHLSLSGNKELTMPENVIIELRKKLDYFNYFD
ncbi:MAG: leucine-rich repeat domain-containing protein [Candidatus Lokiarchaeota archaeon]|nr:leucine-rich repeat domain-containing protein [Candidatus Lokiarchaeota archaeon]